MEQIAKSMENLLRQIRSERPETVHIAIRGAEIVLRESIKAALADDVEMRWLPSYGEIVQWLSDNKGKGLVLMGPVGTGKTLIATRILPALINMELKKILHTYRATELNVEAAERQARLDFLKVIDDVGTEAYVSTYGGGKRWVFSEIVGDAEYYGKFLVVTTNLNPDGIKERYGERVWDRLQAICKVVAVGGDESFRRGLPKFEKPRVKQ